MTCSCDREPPNAHVAEPLRSALNVFAPPATAEPDPALVERVARAMAADWRRTMEVRCGVPMRGWERLSESERRSWERQAVVALREVAA
jgi:hypothetical protein